MTADEIEPHPLLSEPASAPQGSPEPQPTEGSAARPAPPDEVPSPSAFVASTGSATNTGLIAPEVQRLAVELAEEFFRPWELALREQFEAEMALRLESELEYHEHQAETLSGELTERRVMWEGNWTRTHPRGSTTDTAKWEMEQAIRRQTAELADNERKIRELRERLRELGLPTDENIVTVDARPDVPDREKPAD